MQNILTGLLIMFWTFGLMAQEAQTTATPADNEAVSAAPAEPSLNEKSEESKAAPAPTPEAPETVAPKIPAPEKKPAKSQTPKPSTKGLGRLTDLKLSPEQTTAMIEARKSWNSENEKSLRDEVKTAKEDLANAMIDNSSSDEVRKKFLLLQKKYTDLQTLKFEKSLRIREILNLEQRKKFQEIRTKQPEP